jgi:hypothetical protein
MADFPIISDAQRRLLSELERRNAKSVSADPFAKGNTPFGAGPGNVTRTLAPVTNSPFDAPPRRMTPTQRTPTPQSIARRAQFGEDVPKSEVDKVREVSRGGKPQQSLASALDDIGQIFPALGTGLIQYLKPGVFPEFKAIYDENIAKGLGGRISDKALLEAYRAQKMGLIKFSGQQLSSDQITMQQRMQLARQGIEVPIQREDIPEDRQPSLSLKFALDTFGQPDVLLPGVAAGARLTARGRSRCPEWCCQPVTCLPMRRHLLRLVLGVGFLSQSISLLNWLRHKEAALKI